MNGKDNYAGLAKTLADNLEWKYQYERELKEKKEKKMKKQMQSKMTHDYWKAYDREIYMSEYVTIPKTRLRRLIVTEVVAWGISIFLLLISVLR
jgi:pantothenate kinase-related protein Tda10